MESYETEERMVLRKPLFESPGTTEHRGPTPRARASQQKLPGQSMRGERKAEERKAEARNAKPASADDLFAMLDKEARAKEANRAKQRQGLGREDFRWVIDRDSGEASYEKYTDANGVAWMEA